MQQGLSTIRDTSTAAGAVRYKKHQPTAKAVDCRRSSAAEAAVADLLEATGGGDLRRRRKLSSFQLKLSWRRLLGESARGEVE
jgi:hypothetical protein